MLEHTIRLHTRKTIYLNLSLILICHLLHAYFMFYHLARYIKRKIFLFFILFSLDNDDMESSKRCVKLFSLIFILR